jgi:ribokinase
VPAAVTAQAVRRAVGRGARAVLNLAPYAGLPPDVVAAADPVVVNEHEALQLADSGMVPATMVVTFGAAGASWDGDRSTGPQVPAADVVDTTGAGDAFCGAFAHFFARDGDVLAAARRANELAALSTTVRGARITPELVAAADRRPASGAPVRSS